MSSNGAYADEIIRVIKVFIVYQLLYFGLLGFCPPVFRMYLRYYSTTAPVKPHDAPKNIINVKEMEGIHDYDEVLSLIGDEIIIFRNYTNCADKFNKYVYPRHKDRPDFFMTITYNEKGPGNAYVPGVIKGKTVNSTLSQILKDKDPYVYASFLHIIDADDYRTLLDAGKSHKFAFDSSFISHFDRPVVSTETHAAACTQTLSVQCEGSKAWLFFTPKDLTNNGILFEGVPHGVLVNGSPESIVKIPTYRAVVNPNDLLYFPPFHFHAVASTPGRNMMFAIRKIDKRSAKQSFKVGFKQSVLAIQRKLYHYLTSSAQRNSPGFRHFDDYLSFKEAFFEEVHHKRTSIFQDYDGLADFMLPANNVEE